MWCQLQANEDQDEFEKLLVMLAEAQERVSRAEGTRLAPQFKKCGMQRSTQSVPTGELHGGVSHPVWDTAERHNQAVQFFPPASNSKPSVGLPRSDFGRTSLTWTGGDVKMRESTLHFRYHIYDAGALSSW